MKMRGQIAVGRFTRMINNILYAIATTGHLQLEVASFQEGLVVEIGAHEMSNADDVGAEVLEVALVAGGVLEQLELDHVAIVVAQARDRHDRHVVNANVARFDGVREVVVVVLADLLLVFVLFGVVRVGREALESKDAGSGSALL